MPYDPTPVGPNAGAPTLTVHVAGGRGESDVVLVIARPAEGRVVVHEIIMPGGPRRFEAEPSVLLARIERALADGRRVSVEPYRVREWLAGRG